MDKLKPEQQQRVVKHVFGKADLDEVAISLQCKLCALKEWNDLMDAPPVQQLRHSTPQGWKEQVQPLLDVVKIQMDHRKKRDTEHLILQCAPDLDRLEGMFANPAPYHLTVLKFHTFSGDPKVKADVDYKTWHHEVVSAAEGNAKEAIHEAMLQSLKGKAANVA